MLLVTAAAQLAVSAQRLFEPASSTAAADENLASSLAAQSDFSWLVVLITAVLAEWFTRRWSSEAYRLIGLSPDQIDGKPQQKYHSTRVHFLSRTLSPQPLRSRRFFPFLLLPLPSFAALSQ